MTTTMSAAAIIGIRNRAISRNTGPPGKSRPTVAGGHPFPCSLEPSTPPGQFLLALRLLHRRDAVGGRADGRTGGRPAASIFGVPPAIGDVPERAPVTGPQQ